MTVHDSQRQCRMTVSPRARFVAVMLCVFTSLLNLANGVGVAIVGYLLHADAGSVLAAVSGDLEFSNATDHTAGLKESAAADFEDFDAKKVSLLNAVLYISSFMILQSLVGLVGAKFADNGFGRVLLKLYGLTLLLITLALIAVLVAGAYYAGKVDELIETKWEAIAYNLADRDVMGSLARNMTQLEFSETVQSSFGLLQASCTVIVGYALLATLAARSA